MAWNWNCKKIPLTKFVLSPRALHLFGDIVAFQAAGADLQGKGSPLNLGLYLYQIGLPCPAGVVFGVAHLIAGNRMFSTNIAGP